ncbi:hypothetical protein, partial [Acinetobacter baumannii]|uniref:hypothetical protein n=1 Tax=Acinetobacter baumannii TaxID=470 RepID=UPI0011775398
MRTTTQVPWNGPHPATTTGDVIETPDISSVIKEVVNMPGWNEGNYLDVVFFNDQLPDVDETAGKYDCEPSSPIETAPR